MGTDAGTAAGTGTGDETGALKLVGALTRFSFELVCFSSIEEVIEDIESAALTGIFGAIGDEMVPTDPAPLADNKLLPPLPFDMQRRRYFWTNSSWTKLNWVLNSKAESSAGSKVGTTLIKNLSIFFESDDIETGEFDVVRVRAV